MGKLLLCLLVLVLGCAEAPEAEPTAPLTLRIDTQLEPTLQGAVAAAAADWQAAGFAFTVESAEGLYANVRPGSCADLVGEHLAAPGCTRPGKLGSYIHLDWEELDGCRYAVVGGVTQCLKLDPTAIARHEIGHWLGFWGHLPEGNVMQAHYDAGEDYPKALTALDVESVIAAQGQH